MLHWQEKKFLPQWNQIYKYVFSAGINLLIRQ